MPPGFVYVAKIKIAENHSDIGSRVTGMMRLLVLSDIHGSLRRVKSLQDISRDITIVAGDLASCGSLDEARRVLKELVDQGPPVVWVPGNCDTPKTLELSIDNAFLVHAQAVEMKGLVFTGFGGSIYTPFNTPFEYSDEELGSSLAQVLESIGEKQMSRTVLVVHNPPYRSGLDLVRGGEYVGSKRLRELVERYQPRLLLTGHIHESPGVTNLGKTLAVNPGPLERGNYALVLVDPDSGVFVARLRKL